jgi:hypothetical protein
MPQLDPSLRTVCFKGPGHLESEAPPGSLVRLAGTAWRAAHPAAAIGTEPASQSQEVKRKTASSTWTRLIAKVYEACAPWVDPLQSAQCGSEGMNQKLERRLL